MYFDNKPYAILAIVAFAKASAARDRRPAEAAA
jgi:hypothetical protein